MATINGTNGNDTRFGTAGNDVFNLLRGNDRGFGGGGNDQMNGGDGNDQLNSEAGNDVLNGGNGRDILRGSFGDDVLIGGAGADKFGFQLSENTLAQEDTIKDFKRGQGDKIQLGQFKNELFDYLDDSNDGVLNDDDDNVLADGGNLELNFTGLFEKSVILNVENVGELNLSDFIV